MVSYTPPAGFTFDPVTHVGMMDGVPWPSVTQLLNEFKLVDFTGVPPAVLERKQKLGTNVHAATAMIDDCDLDEEHQALNYPETLPYLEAYRKFRVQQPFEPSPKCGRLVSKKWSFHGEPDEHGIRVCNFGNKLALIDFKCTWRMYDSTGPQLSGYAILLDECLKLKVKERYGLLFKPTGGYELVPFNDPIDRNDFLACLHLHWRKRKVYKTTKGVTI